VNILLILFECKGSPTSVAGNPGPAQRPRSPLATEGCPVGAGSEACRL